MRVARSYQSRNILESGLSANLRETYKHDPVAFFHDILGRDLWDRQQELVSAIEETDLVACRSGQKVGKALALNTLVPTKNHGLVPLATIKLHDVLLDENLNPCIVTYLSPIFYSNPCYEIEFSSNAKVIADENHLWFIARESQTHIVTTKNLWENSAAYQYVPPKHVIKRIDKIDAVPTRCLQVDSPSHLFMITDAFIPTHNTLAIAGLGIWWVSTRNEGRAIMTTPTGRQVKALIWREVRSLYYRAKKSLGGELSRDPGTGWRFNDGRELVGFATNEAERMSGYSGSELMFLVDEASGIAEDIFEAIQGNRAGGGKLIMTSNPTQTVGTFYDACTAKRDMYKTLHISSRESPNIVQNKMVVPGLATNPWLEERTRDWGGPGNPIFEVRVEGNFPTEAWNSIISLNLLERARQNYQDHPPHAQLYLGVDIARYGDDETIIFPVRGAHAYPPIALRLLDGPEVGKVVLEAANDLKFHNEVPIVNLDNIGIGVSAFDFLKRHKQVITNPIDVSATADQKDDYSNLRTQLLFGLRDWLKEGGSIPHDPKLEAELVATKYEIDAQGRYKAESKDEVKKLLKRSPDRADALALAVYRPRRKLLPTNLDFGLETKKANFS